MSGAASGHGDPWTACVQGYEELDVKDVMTGQEPSFHPSQQGQSYRSRDEALLSKIFSFSYIYMHNRDLNAF